MLQLLFFGLSMLAGGVLPIITSILLAPRNVKGNPVKLKTYECGETPMGEGRPLLKMQYFTYAIYFTVMDVALAFTIIFVTAFAQLTWLNAFYTLLFFMVISIGLFHSWKSLRSSTGP